MTLLVPFDGSQLAEAALLRATQFGRAFEEDVLAVSVVPENDAEYARERGWLDGDESFEMDSVVGRLHERVTARCPSADFRHERVGRYAAPGTIATRLRTVAKREEASMVFVGSENAGHIVTAMSSVGSKVAADEAYDVVVVRHRRPREMAALSEATDRTRPKSDFYHSD